MQAICNEIDARGEGVINFPTFLQIMQRPFPPPETEDEVIAAFEVRFLDPCDLWLASSA